MARDKHSVILETMLFSVKFDRAVTQDGTSGRYIQCTFASMNFLASILRPLPPLCNVLIC